MRNQTRMDLLVIVLYGGPLLLGVLPTARSHVSWDGHLCAAASGAALAFLLTRESAHQS